MKAITKYFFFLLAFVAFSACQEDLKIEDAGSLQLSGDWTVIEYSLDADPLYGPYELQLYNTATGTDSIWIENIYDSGYKVKSAKLSETTFAVTGATDVNGEADGLIDIIDGKVINNDSIVFRVVLYDEDGEVVDDYLESGHRYTGWQD
ncbi:lipid-binding protein [uncultured Sunxiuqinia sp.]|uniref:lipid-binding protein n=1 Tax=Sunxiuqinia rutila TaxID=1397841 RepID=UPI00263582F1|nr:lipid-binding protein [uncultured Sunxiuqinia sp.]